MTRLLAIAPLLLVACSAEPAPADEHRLEEALAKLEQAQSDIEKAKVESTQAALGAASKAMGALDEVEREVEADAPSLCWQDYCPCDEGPDYGGADVGLCRNLKAGVRVDDDILAAGAMMRDARRQLREFDETNPDF